MNLFKEKSVFKFFFSENSLLFITDRTTHGHLDVMTTFPPVHGKVAHLLNAEITHPVKEKLSQDTDEQARFLSFLVFKSNFSSLRL